LYAGEKGLIFTLEFSAIQRYYFRFDMMKIDGAVLQWYDLPMFYWRYSHEFSSYASVLGLILMMEISAFTHKPLTSLV